MKISIHQPEFLPWLPFFDKVDQVDEFVLLDSVQFEKGYFHNRAKIFSPQSGFQLVTWAVEGSQSFDTSISDRKVLKDHRVSKKSLELIRQTYKKAAYFQNYFPTLEKILGQHEKLGALNIELIQWLCQSFGISTRLHVASQLNFEIPRGGTAVNFTISQKLGASSYLSGRMGGAYLDESPFVQAGIKVWYHDYELARYSQPGGKDFIAGLSSLDLLFHQGPNSILILRQGRKAPRENSAN